jgi:hypothetical protein
MTPSGGADDTADINEETNDPVERPRLPRIIPATARIVPERKPSRTKRIRQHRQAQAWQRKAGTSSTMSYTLQCNYRCAAEVYRSRQLSGQPIPEWLKRHYARLHAEILSSTRRETDCDTDEDGQSVHEWLISREVATMLQISPRQVQRLAGELGGRLIGGRWVFNRSAVEAHAVRTDRA